MLKRLWLLVMTALLGACGGGSLSTPTSSATSLDPLMHTWAPYPAAICNSLTSAYGDVWSYEYNNIQLVGLNMLRTMSFFTDTNCTQAKYQVVYIYDLTWGNEITTSQGNAFQVSAPAPSVYSYSGFTGSQLSPYTIFGLSGAKDIFAVRGQYFYLGDSTQPLDANGYPTQLQSTPSYQLVN
jgi:hypothetical protein